MTVGIIDLLLINLLVDPLITAALIIGRKKDILYLSLYMDPHQKLMGSIRVQKYVP